MSLILTHLSRHGIIHLSDSATTTTDPTTGAKSAGSDGQKTFAIKHLSAGITCAGRYSAGGQPMDLWLSRVIDEDAKSGNTVLSKFADFLTTELQRDREPGGAYMMHLAGYASDQEGHHPEFYFIRNVHAIGASGNYEDVRDPVACSEDFWNRDCHQRGNLMFQFTQGAHLVYCNAFPEGRMVFNELERKTNELFQQIWSQQGWGLVQPRDLSETEDLLKARIEVIFSLFRFSTFGAPIIGGPVQTCAILAPADTVTKC